MILNKLIDILFSFFAYQYPINISKLHLKAIQFASLLWHPQMAPSFTSIYCSTVLASYLLLHSTMKYNNLCNYITFFFFNIIFLLFFFCSFFFFLICSEFCHTLKLNGLEFTCLPHPDPPSHLPLYPHPPGLPRAPGPSACLMHPTWAGDLFHPW